MGVEFCQPIVHSAKIAWIEQCQKKPSKREAEARADAQFVAGTPLNQTAGSFGGMELLALNHSVAP